MTSRPLDLNNPQDAAIHKLTKDLYKVLEDFLGITWPDGSERDDNVIPRSTHVDMDREKLEMVLSALVNVTSTVLSSDPSLSALRGYNIALLGAIKMICDEASSDAKAQRH